MIAKNTKCPFFCMLNVLAIRISIFGVGSHSFFWNKKSSFEFPNDLSYNKIEDISFTSRNSHRLVENRS